MIGVAISTTGDPHRLGLLSACVAHWREALLGSYIFVTVDGDEAAVAAARQAVHATRGFGGTTWRVGQPTPEWSHPMGLRDGRLGVAVSKNTGIELLMEAGCTQMFLSDDDTWPISPEAVREHTDLGLPHSMVCWGRHRRAEDHGTYADWTWPRGSMLYVERPVIERLGGFLETFGPGGHEHVEFSRRIHTARFTPCNYPTPSRYTQSNYMGAAGVWHCEDMQKPGESMARTQVRRRLLTSVRRAPGDDEFISRIMNDQEGSMAYVPYRAETNLRQSATMS